MQYIDERIIFDFYDITSSNYNGVYRYDILLDNETIFVGNVFSNGETPKIDITEVLRNYYDTTHNFTSTPTKSNIIREVTVVLYNKDQTDEESMTDKIAFIYRNPNYNSSVSTPINDTTTLTIPLMQGFVDSKLILPPTYPIASEVLDLEFTGLYGNMPVVDSFNVNYPNAIDTNAIQVNKSAGAGAFSYSVKLNDLVKGLELTDESYKPISGFLSSTDSYWKIGYPSDSDGTIVLKAKYLSNNTPTDIDKMTITYGTLGSPTAGVLGDDGIISWQNTITTDRNKQNSYDSTTIKVSFIAGSLTRRQLTLKVNTTLQDRYLTNGTYTLYYSGRFNTTTAELELTVKLKVTENKILTPCDAKDIDMVVFSPINPAVRYSYKIANLDGNSRYFLKWRDRYGMTQIQPFKGTYTYSENTTKSTITNYKNIKRLTDVAVNSKWKLNSDWISESLYPYYESIFVSPWLQLYDSKEDKLYSVILTDTEYTEKTFKNQNRSLFNLQLEVELDSTQTIIY